MTLYDFIQINELQQAEAVWEGVHIDTRDDGIHTVLLYQINNNESFYVEVYYHKKNNIISRLRPFKSMELLHALYAYKINIAKLMNH
ncbi:MAG: hypothetical protein M3352_00765 [Bacteroidota bacterium]|nr:hypothetical protein [Bacteroidota bacterium]